MPKRLDLVGQKFGRLNVKEFYDVQHGMSRWLCDCDCGNKNIIVYGRHMKSGNTVSCGCYFKENNSKFNYKHGGCNDRLYCIWADMKDRCKNKNNAAYNWYGGKGISVCNEWENDYISFKKWAMNNGYKENLSIDRINSNDNYCPNNCQWITLKENMDKARIKYSGTAYNARTKETVEFSSLSEFAKLHNYNPHTVQCAYKRNKKYKEWIFVINI